MRCDGSRSSISRPSGRFRAIPMAIQVAMDVPWPPPASRWLISDWLRPTRRPSSACVSCRRRRVVLASRPRVEATAWASRAPAISAAVRFRLAISTPSLPVALHWRLATPLFRRHVASGRCVARRHTHGSAKPRPSPARTAYASAKPGNIDRVDIGGNLAGGEPLAGDPGRVAGDRHPGDQRWRRPTAIRRFPARMTSHSPSIGAGTGASIAVMRWSSIVRPPWAIARRASPDDV
jgi:hypothetical protein